MPRMPTIGDAGPPKDFAHAFGDALCQYLAANSIGQSHAARLLGIETGDGKKRKGGARIHSYCHDSKSGKRTKPTAEILYLAVTKLPGFKFEYNRYRISAEMLNGNGSRPLSEPRPEQRAFEFMHQFNLTRKQGMIAVKVRRQPSGRLEVALSMDAKAS